MDLDLDQRLGTVLTVIYDLSQQIALLSGKQVFVCVCVCVTWRMFVARCVCLESLQGHSVAMEKKLIINLKSPEIITPPTPHLPFKQVVHSVLMSSSFLTRYLKSKQ